MNAIPNRRRLLLRALIVGATASAAAIPAFAAPETLDSVLSLVRLTKRPGRALSNSMIAATTRRLSRRGGPRTWRSMRS
jgi:hypothetical protein